jgi:peptide/nickel transport system substrate-binding protein
LTETDQPITEFIGTGPYKFVERLPDQYTRVARFDEYQSPPGEPDGYAGSRRAIIDEIRFVPVPSNPTRIAGVISGQYAFADTLPGDTLAQLKAAPNVTPILVRPDWTAFMVINNKGGATANPKVRQAMMAALNPEEMLTAAYGDPELFYVDGSVYGKGALYYNTEATAGFNANDPEKAKELLQEAGYNSEPIRLMTSAQLDVLYKTTLVAKENLERAGFTVDVQVMDWAAVTQKRLNPDEWEGFMAWHSFTPEPSTLTFVNPGYPGWWDNDKKSELMNAFTSTDDQDERVRIWGELQNLLYEQAATLIVGHFFTLTAINDQLENFQPMPWPFFWNVSLKD